MGLADITRDDVLAAVREFDRLGRDEFLRRYGFGRARAYLLEVDGKLYDSKAIVVYAHSVGQGELLAADFRRRSNRRTSPPETGVPCTAVEEPQLDPR